MNNEIKTGVYTIDTLYAQRTLIGDLHPLANTHAEHTK